MRRKRIGIALRGSDSGEHEWFGRSAGRWTVPRGASSDGRTAVFCLARVMKKAHAWVKTIEAGEVQITAIEQVKGAGSSSSWSRRLTSWTWPPVT